MHRRQGNGGHLFQQRYHSLLIERRSFLKDGRPVEVTKSYYRGDAYDFVAELTLGPDA